MDYQHVIGTVAGTLRARGIDVSLPAKRKTPDFQTHISGIPCGIIVDHYNCVKPFKGSPHRCDSDLDFYGYTEFEFTVLDRCGYRARWLEHKLTQEDEDRILEEYKTLLTEEEE